MDAEQIAMNNDENQPEGKSVGREILEWIACILVAVIITMVLRNYVFTLVKVDGSSMNPTLQNGERLVMIRLGYKPEREDIVVVDSGTSSKAPWIKRVIGVPGDKLEFKEVEEVVQENGKIKVTKKVELYLNGTKQEESYISSSDRYGAIGDCYATVIGKGIITVPENHIFVMGDNRTNSSDSRVIGFVPYENVLGHASFRIWPLNQIGKP